MALLLAKTFPRVKSYRLRYLLLVGKVGVNKANVAACLVGVSTAGYAG